MTKFLCLGFFSDSHALFFNERITARLAFSHLPLGFRDVAPQRMSEDTVRIRSPNLKWEETNISHKMLHWKARPGHQARLRSRCPTNQPFLIYVLSIHLLLETSSFVGHKYFLQATSLGHGTAHQAACTSETGKNP